MTINIFVTVFWVYLCNFFIF